jgi:hypothetical protein
MIYTPVVLLNDPTGNAWKGAIIRLKSAGRLGIEELTESA